MLARIVAVLALSMPAADLDDFSAAGTAPRSITIGHKATPFSHRVNRHGPLTMTIEI